MRVLLTIVAIWAAGLGAAAQFGKMSVLFDGLGTLYPGHSLPALGVIVSVVGMVGLIFGTTSGLFVARIGPRRAIVAALLVGAGMSAVQSLGLPYGVMIFSRVIEGFSHLAIVVVGPTLIAGLATDRYRSLAMSLWSTFFGLTYAVLALFAPPLIAAYGAAGVYLAHGAWMVGMAVLLGLLLPPDRRSAAPPAAGNLLAQHVEIYRSPRMAAPAMGFFCYTFLYVAVLTLLPPETPITQRALVAFGMPMASIVLSLTLGVWLLGRMRAVTLVQVGYACAIPGFLLLAIGWGQGPFMVVAGFWLAGALGLVQGASFAAIPQLNATAQTRAGASGAIAQLGNLGTTTGTPLLAAVLAGGGPWSLAIVATLACGLGIALHRLQTRRRQTLST